MGAMIGGGRDGCKAGSGADGARRADAAILALATAVGLALCGAAALRRRAELAAAPPPPGPEAVTHFVDLRAAGEAELMLLPGVGPRLAERIAVERAAGGPFASLEEVDRRVPGVGPARVRWWRDRVRPFDGARDAASGETK